MAIARMLLQKAPVMVFDDSLSAVDSQTDSLIRKALKEHMKDAAVILISHRVTTLMGADQIMVLNHGKIEEMGTHQELIQNHGIYRRIYDIQMSQDDRESMHTGMKRISSNRESMLEGDASVPDTSTPDIRIYAENEKGVTENGGI